MQRDDPELDAWMSEIRLRAGAQIGKISRELEKAQHGGSGGGSKLPPLATSKEQQLTDAGLSVRTANRYEQPAAPGAQLAPKPSRPKPV
jgi:hypothetical protein